MKVQCALASSGAVLKAAAGSGVSSARRGSKEESFVDFQGFRSI